MIRKRYRVAFASVVICILMAPRAWSQSGWENIRDTPIPALHSVPRVEEVDSPVDRESSFAQWSVERLELDSRANGPFRSERQIAAFLLVIPGAALVGMGLGLLVDEPGAGTIVGVGVGAFAWGMTIALK